MVVFLKNEGDGYIILNCSDEITTTPFLHLRYHGTDCALMCSADIGGVAGDQAEYEVEGVANGESARCKYGDFHEAFVNR